MLKERQTSGENEVVPAARWRSRSALRIGGRPSFCGAWVALALLGGWGHLKVDVNNLGVGEEGVCGSLFGHTAKGGYKCTRLPIKFLNCEHCMARCRAQRLDWLLHVDSDEQLWLPEMAARAPQREHAGRAASSKATGRPKSTGAPTTRVALSPLQAHLDILGRRGALLFTYRNLEAVPEQLECADPFREISLFKQHSSQLDAHHPAVAAALGYWTSADGAGGEYFRFYQNGKSIVRVHAEMRVAASVHEWTLPSRAAIEASGFTNNPSLRQSNSKYIPHQKMQVEEACGAVPLHFPVCSFSVFWNKRWAALGYASPNHRFRGNGGGLDQRAHALSLGQRREEAEALYRRAMVVESAPQLRAQLDAAVCVRYDALRALVGAARAHLLPSHSGAAAREAVRTTRPMGDAEAAHVQAVSSAAARAVTAAVAGDAFLQPAALQAVAEAATT
eukprot:2127706-Prymnesium_polylepis.1